MALIDELKEKREVWLCNVALHDQRVVDECLNASRARDMVADLDRAIAALEPAPIPEPDLIDEASVAREQLETDHALPPSADDVVTDLQGDTVEEMREAFEDVFEAQAEPVEHISILTGDPAIEPESGLHGDPVPQTEGYAPVTNPEADFWARGLERDQKPQTYNPFNIFRREKEDA